MAAVLSRFPNLAFRNLDSPTPQVITGTRSYAASRERTKSGSKGARTMPRRAVCRSSRSACLIHWWIV